MKLNGLVLLAASVVLGCRAESPRIGRAAATPEGGDAPDSAAHASVVRRLWAA